MEEYSVYWHLKYEILVLGFEDDLYRETVFLVEDDEYCYAAGTEELIYIGEL